MFLTYSTMTALEAAEFSYNNGIYAGDMFIMTDGTHKQHDWNIRRSGRSPSESLIIFGMSAYQTKITLRMADFEMEGQLNNLQMFRVYTQICERLVNDCGIYVSTTGYGYCGKDKATDILMFHVIVHSKSIVDIDNHEQSLHNFSKSEHRQKVAELVRRVTEMILQKQ
ncbi:unnamed protein product [Rotaria sp. Silwood2]|nr:unnamed protein product [Rotaria sp. Silwood2]CAF3154797.1 unnamed protein product [Rotaria sp. Silwood2]CAF3359684.1 unnamed protein product [Rotaria sp. Silwood2]CAF3964552.1 unnamed protein product [Rotaria sp. Silwood2]CAF4009085.1 unnamed protein product [Rotaria sp. Silwood2]